MNNLPRRSARLSQLHQPQSSIVSLSSTSQSSSVSHSAYPSPADEFAHQQHQLRLQLQSQLLAAPPQFNAPLPSPAANEYNPFFGYAQSQQGSCEMPQQSQQTAQQSHQQHGRSGSDKTQNHTTEHHNSFSSQQRPNTQTGNDAGQLPPDFLAEAARRAQIACLMRDMGECYTAIYSPSLLIRLASEILPQVPTFHLALKVPGFTVPKFLACDPLLTATQSAEVGA